MAEARIRTVPPVLLTQDHCPNCERLGALLAKLLKGQFDAQIEVCTARSS